MSIYDIVLVSSYVFKMNVEKFNIHNWDRIIVDEAQYVKTVNGNVLTQAIQQLNVSSEATMWLLSGDYKIAIYLTLISYSFQQLPF